jgi:hypothetical protein
MPSPLVSLILIGCFLIFLIFFGNKGAKSDRSEAETTSLGKREEWPADDEEDKAREYPDYYDPENWKKF